MQRVQKGQAASFLIKCGARQLELFATDISMLGGAMTCIIGDEETALAHSG
jgi:hypothetical protein